MRKVEEVAVKRVNDSGRGQEDQDEASSRASKRQCTEANQVTSSQNVPSCNSPGEVDDRTITEKSNLSAKDGYQGDNEMRSQPPSQSDNNPRFEVVESDKHECTGENKVTDQGGTSLSKGHSKNEPLTPKANKVNDAPLQLNQDGLSIQTFDLQTVQGQRLDQQTTK